MSAEGDSPAGSGRFPQDTQDAISLTEAAQLLEVSPDRIAVMVDEGLLTPGPDAANPYSRAETLALRNLGG